MILQALCRSTLLCGTQWTTNNCNANYHVLIGILMRNLVNYKCSVSCADRHRHAEPGELGITVTLNIMCRWQSSAESSELQIGRGWAYMVNCADSSLFAGNRIRLPIGTVTLKHSKPIKSDETCLLNFTDCSSYTYCCTIIFSDTLVTCKF